MPRYDSSIVVPPPARPRRVDRNPDALASRDLGREFARQLNLRRQLAGRATLGAGRSAPAPLAPVPTCRGGADSATDLRQARPDHPSTVRSPERAGATRDRWAGTPIDTTERRKRACREPDTPAGTSDYRIDDPETPAVRATAVGSDHAGNDTSLDRRACDAPSRNARVEAQPDPTHTTSRGSGQSDAHRDASAAPVIGIRRIVGTGGRTVSVPDMPVDLHGASSDASVVVEGERAASPGLEPVAGLFARLRDALEQSPSLSTERRWRFDVEETEFELGVTLIRGVDGALTVIIEFAGHALDGAYLRRELRRRLREYDPGILLEFRAGPST